MINSAKIPFFPHHATFSLPDRQEQNFFIPLLSGMSARVCSVAFVSPLEMIRTKMQSQKLNYSGKCDLHLHCPIQTDTYLYFLQSSATPCEVSSLYEASLASIKASHRLFCVTCHFPASTGASTNRSKPFTM